MLRSSAARSAALSDIALARARREVFSSEFNRHLRATAEERSTRDVREGRASLVNRE
jgi:hypothetical protein